MQKKPELINRFYIIKCFNESESFIKVGTTGTSLNRRYSGKKMPYSWAVISEVMCSVSSSLGLEDLIDHNFKNHTPSIKFGGYLECFNCSDLESIYAMADKHLKLLDSGV